jgi:YVTN family beta-propeller protein
MLKRSLSALFTAVTAALAAFACSGGTPLAHGDEAKASLPRTSLRKPIALAQSGDGKWLFVANQGNGSVSVIDLQAKRLAVDYPVGNKLVDLAITADGARLLAIDEGTGELIVLERQGPKLTVRKRIPVGQAPQSVQVFPDGSRCVVACLWSRQLAIVALSENPQVVSHVELPFAPRSQLQVQPGKLVVAEAFGGRVAVVDMRAVRLESVRLLPDHNIRELALSADRTRLLLTTVMLNSFGRAQKDDIHWGNLLTNNVRSLRLSSVLDPKADLLTGSDLLHLGDVDHGTGDPSGVAVCGDRLVVSLSGVNELAVGGVAGDSWKYLTTGRRPTALLASPDNREIYLANTFSDSISVIDPVKVATIAEISLGKAPEFSAAERGELLFYDAHLSHDGWLSCHSCHTDGHTSSRLADTLGDGNYGTPKRILTLLGVGDTGPWAWNGSMAKLESQVDKSISTTMHGPKPTPQQVAELTAFLKTLAPAPPLSPQPSDEAAVRRGKEVFTSQNCARCHTPPLYTSDGTYDVGLADENDHKTFNPPSLRGVSQGGPYFHDGRARSLEEVFVKHRHQLKDDLSEEEIADLIKFLGTI